MIDFVINHNLDLLKFPLKNNLIYINMTVRLDRFIMNYQGNKYSEIKKYWDDLELDLSEYDIIAEPFCGIFGFSRVCYEKGFKGEYYLNDLDHNLINSLKQLKENPQELIEELEKFYKQWEGKEDKELTDFLKKEDTGDYWIYKNISSSISNCYNIKKGNRKIINYKEKLKEYNQFFNKSTLFNLECGEFINKLQKIKNKKILVFLDPPYFNSCNTSYIAIKKDNKEDKHIEIVDNTYIYPVIFEFFKTHKKHITPLCIMNKTELIHYNLKPYAIGEFKKVYQNSNKTTKGGYKKRSGSHVIYKIK